MSNGNTIRVISGAVLVVILAALAYFGGILLLAGTGVISVIGIQEYFRVMGLTDSKLYKPACVLSLIYLPALYFLKEDAVIPFLIIGFLLYAVILVRFYPAVPFREFSAAAASLIYLPVFSGFLYLIRDMEQGTLLFILVFLCSWLGDTFGYAIGRRFGKHKMTPLLSPKKSVEGLIAELIGVSVTAVVFGLIFRGKLSAYRFPVAACAVCGLFGSVLSVFGDLFASAIKREFGIKDYGTLIPGHGGILDRFDSALFTAPFVYLIFRLLFR